MGHGSCAAVKLAMDDRDDIEAAIRYKKTSQIGAERTKKSG